MKKNSAHLIASSKRLIIKIGSALVVDGSDGTPQTDWLNSLADDISSLIKDGKQVCLVSSGAVALGRQSLGIGFNIPSKAIELEKKQAAAAVGQIRLCQIYQDIFRARGINVAQILLTPADTETRKTHLNARAAMNELLKAGILPVINENDTTATEEIRFGDNDKLAARVAQMIAADTLLILSTTDGLYTDDPRINSKAEHLPYIESLNAETMALAKDALAGLSTGGMKSKIESARLAVNAGTQVIIAKGTIAHPIQYLSADDAVCTIIAASGTPSSARKRWIQSHLTTKGRIMVDDGAINALKNGKSLLSAGVRQADGRFDSGDAVKIYDLQLNEIGIGLVRYDSDETQLILGKKSSEIPDILGYSGHDEFIHRDDLALT